MRTGHDFQSGNHRTGEELVDWAMHFLREHEPQRNIWIGDVEADIFARGVFIECKAGNADTKQPGLQRSDNVLKAIGQAAIYKHQTGGLFVVVTTYAPKPGTHTANKLAAAIAAGHIDAVCVRGDAEDEQELLELLTRQPTNQKATNQ